MPWGRSPKGDGQDVEGGSPTSSPLGGTVHSLTQDSPRDSASLAQNGNGLEILPSLPDSVSFSPACVKTSSQINSALE